MSTIKSNIGRIFFFIQALNFFTFYAVISSAFAQEIEYDSNFLRGGAKTEIDISRFSRPVSYLPGEHLLDIYVNDDLLGREKIKILDKSSNEFCFTGQQVLAWRLKFDRIPDGESLKKKLLGENDSCVDIYSLIPDVKVQPKPQHNAINIIVPQAYQDNLPFGYVDPEFWDEGVPAAFLKYRYSASKLGGSLFGGGNSSFLGVDFGASYGLWRFRHNGSFYKPSNGSSQYSVSSNFLQRDLIGWKSKLTIGDSFTQGQIFDPVNFRGVRVSSDESMLPGSLTGFAPEIKGFADTNAVVNIYQGGQIVFQTQVPPGSFVIDDLKTSGSAGDLEVVVKESDGRDKKFTVPFSYVVQLLRPGMWRYSIIGGQVRTNKVFSGIKPSFLEGTIEYGVSNIMSFYSGVTFAEKYSAGVLGAAFNTSIGALAVDITKSYARDLPEKWINGAGSSLGESYRISFNKNFTKTNTNVYLAAYRYSSQGFLNLDDFTIARNYSNMKHGDWNIFPRRGKFQAFISQTFKNYGSFYSSGVTENYWQGRSRSTTYTLGYTFPFNWGTLQLNLDRYEILKGNRQNRASVNMSIPLSNHNIGVAVSHSDGLNNSGSTMSLSATGYLDESGQLSYALYTDKTNAANSNSTYVGSNVRYDGANAGINLNLGKNSNGSTSYGIGVDGGIVFHSGGINFTAVNSETIAIVEAPGATGAKINGDSRAVIAKNGYGISSNLVPYRRNMIWLSPEDISTDVEIVSQGRDVAPTEGAFVKLKFETNVGALSLIKISLENGKVPPSGADVRLADGSSVSVVGQSGYVFLRGLEGKHTLNIVWGSSDNEQCVVNYVSTSKDALNKSPFDEQALLCK